VCGSNEKKYFCKNESCSNRSWLHNKATIETMRWVLPTTRLATDIPPDLTHQGTGAILCHHHITVAADRAEVMVRRAPFSTAS